MISQDLYEFLTNDLKCPYEGKVQGLGEAYAHLVVTKDSTANDLSENISGNFYQPNYVSVVAPQAKTDDDEIGKKILDQIIHQRPDGTYDICDVDRQRYQGFTSNIKSVINVRGNSLSLEISDELGNSYKYNTDNLQGYINDLSNSVPWGQIGFDSFGLLIDASEHTYGKLKTGQKSSLIHKSKKLLKKKGINIKTKNSIIYRQKIPRFYKNTGRVLLGVSIAFMAEDIISNKAVKASNVLDATMLGVSFIPGYGWAIGGTYFLLDLGFIYFSGASIGDQIDNLLNDYTPVSDGIILDLESTFDWIENQWDDFWDDINLPDLMY